MGKLCNFRGNKYQLPIGQMSNYGIAFNVERKPENMGVNAIGSSIADVKLNYAWVLLVLQLQSRQQYACDSPFSAADMLVWPATWWP